MCSMYLDMEPDVIIQTNGTCAYSFWYIFITCPYSVMGDDFPIWESDEYKVSEEKEDVKAG